MSDYGYENGVTLGQLIEELKKIDANRIIKFGFARPHSYRGYYDELAFEPRKNVTAGSMLACAESAVGNVFSGYKGGDYTMTELTDCWIANYGCCGVGLSPELLGWMFGKKLAVYEDLWACEDEAAERQGGEGRGENG